MKNFNFSYKTLAISAALLFSLSSCKKEFLEVLPKGKLIAEKTSDYDALFNTVASSSIREITLYMADDVAGLLPTYNSNSVLEKRLFEWADDIYEDDENPGVLVPWLKLLYSMNKIANEVMDSEGGSLQDRKALLAEARVMRAWIHFYLVNLYGKPYQASTAAQDLGFPIILTNDLTRTEFERHSVAQVYAFIENELKAAIPDLPETISNRYRISKAAGHAYLGKTYMFMGRYKEAISSLEAAIAASRNASIPVRLYDYNVETTSATGAYAPEAYGPKVVSASDYAEALHAIEQSIGSNLIFFNATYFIKKSVVDEFTASDRRRVFFTNANFFSFTPFPNGMVRIYGRTNTFTLGANLPDVQLLLAEAKARENQIAEAKQLLEDFRKLRMSASDAVIANGLSKENLVREVIAERKREFVGIGDRWFTIRRLSEDPLFPNIANYSHIVYAADGSVSEEFTLKKERLTMRLPKKLMLENPNMTQNP